MPASNYRQVPIIMYLSDVTKQVKKRTALIKMVVSDFSKLCWYIKQVTEAKWDREQTLPTLSDIRRIPGTVKKKTRGHLNQTADLINEVMKFVLCMMKSCGFSGRAAYTLGDLLLCRFQVRLPFLCAGLTFVK